MIKYAIAQSSGGQLRVEENTLVDVDKLAVDVGDSVEMPILLLSDDNGVQIGCPLVEGAKVKATVLRHLRARKIRVFKYRSKSRYRRRRGHRQDHTRLKIDSIMGSQSSIVSLTEMGVGARAKAALVNAGITTSEQALGKLAESGEKGLLDIPGFGQKGLGDLKSALRSLGFELPGE